MPLPADYYTKNRSDLATHLEGTAHRVLDIGCGTGNLGASLKRSNIATEVIGIELDARAADTALATLDGVHLIDLSREPLPSDFGKFTAVFLADVLEHLPDPWRLLKDLHPHLTDDAQLIASIPNISAVTVIYPLLFKDAFTYRDSGILDRTHLRFFTRQSALQLFRDTGYGAIVVGKNTVAVRRGPLLRAAAHLLGRLGTEQWLIKSSPDRAPTG